MEKDDSKTLLGGFETILDNLLPGAHNTEEDHTEEPVNVEYDEPIDDDELEQIIESKKRGKKTEEESTEDDEPIEEPVKKTKPKKQKPVEEEEEPAEESVEEEDHSAEEGDEDTELITTFFDSIAEKLGLELDEDEEKPTTAEELVDYITEVIESNSVPEYANEEVAKLDEFVRNGGKLQDFYEKQPEFDLDEIDTENEEHQKLIIREFYKRKGFNDTQIKKKLTKFEDAGMLQDESEEDLEALREMISEEQEQLLESQKIYALKAKEQQQQFYTTVVNEIKAFDNLYGVKVPQNDRKELLDYIFRPVKDGLTKYQMDYAKSPKNLIASAYLTMKGDFVIDSAKQSGKASAIDAFKKKMRSTSVGKKTKPVNHRDEGTSVWTSVARQLVN